MCVSTTRSIARSGTSFAAPSQLLEPTAPRIANDLTRSTLGAAMACPFWPLTAIDVRIDQTVRRHFDGGPQNPSTRCIRTLKPIKENQKA